MRIVVINRNCVMGKRVDTHMTCIWMGFLNRCKEIPKQSLPPKKYFLKFLTKLELC